MAAKKTSTQSATKAPVNPKLKDGDPCTVVAGTHKGKSGKVTDINISKTGHMTTTVVQKNGERFKTLARNVEVQAPKAAPKAGTKK